MKIFGLRHGETRYTNIYPDLTEKGKADVEKAAEEIQKRVGNDEVKIYSSPAVRARGTADIVAAKFGVEVQETKALRGFEIKDYKEALPYILALIKNAQTDAEKIAVMDKNFMENPIFENCVDLWEKRSTTAKRGYLNLRNFLKTLQAEDLTAPRSLIMVTHFEVLNLLLDEHFEMNGDYINPGEFVEAHLVKLDSEEARLLVQFRDKLRRVKVRLR